MLSLQMLSTGCWGTTRRSISMTSRAEISTESQKTGISILMSRASNPIKSKSVSSGKYGFLKLKESSFPR